MNVRNYVRFEDQRVASLTPLIAAVFSFRPQPLAFCPSRTASSAEFMLIEMIASDAHALLHILRSLVLRGKMPFEIGPIFCGCS